MSAEPSISPALITQTERLIRPYIRRTPWLRVDMANFGRPSR
jgi:threonine dehydratase